MKNVICYIVALLFLLSCGKRTHRDQASENNALLIPLELTEEQANQLAELPLACIQSEYPNHLVHTLNDKSDLHEPHVLYPAFHGCFDWHSAVHGHWSLVRLLKRFLQLEKADTIRQLLIETISKENILAEAVYFQKEQNKSFERTYGWAWLLKLAEELHTWDDPLARELEMNLQPLTDQIANMFVEFLPKLKYPVRVGEHTNTAFGLIFAFDYAEKTANEQLKSAIIEKASEFYLNDVNCPLDWEPSGYDFLSPCFEEIDLMRRVLDKERFSAWISDFAPTLNSAEFNLPVGVVTDRTDGKLVHLDGLNFSRAWVMYGLAEQYPEYRFLIKNANEHIQYSLPNLIDDEYEGGHWLGTFAIYALD